LEKKMSSRKAKFLEEKRSMASMLEKRKKRKSSESIERGENL